MKIMRWKIHILETIYVILMPCTFISVSFSQEVEMVEEPLEAIEEMNDSLTKTSDIESVKQSAEDNGDNSDVAYDIDAQTYEEIDDDFVPSEEIPADEPIQFPTNI